MVYKNTEPSGNVVGGHSTSETCNRNACDTAYDYLLIGKQQLYPRVRSAPHLRLLSSSVEHAPRHHSEESTNYPETTLHSAILPTQVDPSSPSPVGGHPTLTIGLPQSAVLSPKVSSVIVLTPSDVALTSGKFQSDVPTVAPTVASTHVGIIVGSVLGGLVAILLGVVVCYCLFRKTRKGRRRKVGYNNLQSEDERPYLLGPEGDDNWSRYPQIDDLSTHKEQHPLEFGGRGRYISLPQQSRRGVHYSYPLADLTPSYRGHDMTFSSVGGEESQSVLMEDLNGPGQQRDVEPNSRVNDLAERGTASALSAYASSRASILSWARTAFGFAEPRLSTGYHSTSSRTTVVDMDQISLPRRLQKWQRPSQPRRGAG